MNVQISWSIADVGLRNLSLIFLDQLAFEGGLLGGEFTVANPPTPFKG
jgi:hypothetical protein